MKLFALVSALMLCFDSSSQLNYWQQEVHYKIDVTLNSNEKSIKAFEELEYINHSPDTLTYIWFHLWPNAKKN